MPRHAIIMFGIVGIICGMEIVLHLEAYYNHSGLQISLILLHNRQSRVDNKS